MGSPSLVRIAGLVEPSLELILREFMGKKAASHAQPGRRNEVHGARVGGERDTRQRRAIQDALEHAGRPLAPAEILELARVQRASLGLATVYRNLRAMLDSGWLVAVEMPGGGTRYELAGKHHHHHFHCRGCDRVFELEGCQELPALKVPRGFRVEEHELVLYGRCPDCRKPG